LLTSVKLPDHAPDAGAPFLITAGQA
jgi:hypothetical protein